MKWSNGNGPITNGPKRPRGAGGRAREGGVWRWQQRGNAPACGRDEGGEEITPWPTTTVLSADSRSRRISSARGHADGTDLVQRSTA